MSEYFNIAFSIIVGAFVVAVSRYFIPWVKRQVESIDCDFIRAAAKTAVEYAEQTIKGEGKGKERRDAAISFIKSMLEEKGIHITDEQINAFIESAVYVMNHEAEAAAGKAEVAA